MSSVTEQLYIWIVRWGDFQHYASERDRAPAWIKTYTKQLDDDRYLDLSPTQRALLADLRLAFSRARAELRLDRKRLTLRLSMTVYQRDLEALNHAGFIDFCSREVLDQRLEKFYSNSSPRARPRTRREEEKELEKEQDLKKEPPSFLPELSAPSPNGRQPATANDPNPKPQLAHTDDDIPF